MLCFLGWINYHLTKKDESKEISDLRELGDGSSLITLLENISGKCLPAVCLNPRTKIERCNNLYAAFSWMRDEKIHLENCGVEDVLNQNLKIIMGMVWTLIIKYQLDVVYENQGMEREKSTAKKKKSNFSTMPKRLPVARQRATTADLFSNVSTSSTTDKNITPAKKHSVVKKKPLQRTMSGGVVRDTIKTMTIPPRTSKKNTNNTIDSFNQSLLLESLCCLEEYPNVTISNFTTSWKSGLAFAALIHYFDPGAIDFFALKEKHEKENLAKCFKILKSRFGVPSFLKPEDFLDRRRIDKKSVVTYVALCVDILSRQTRAAHHAKAFFLPHFIQTKKNTSSKHTSKTFKHANGNATFNRDHNSRRVSISDEVNIIDKKKHNKDQHKDKFRNSTTNIEREETKNESDSSTVFSPRRCKSINDIDTVRLQLDILLNQIATFEETKSPKAILTDYLLTSISSYDKGDNLSGSQGHLSLPVPRRSYSFSDVSGTYQPSFFSRKLLSQHPVSISSDYRAKKKVELKKWQDGITKRTTRNLMREKEKVRLDEENFLFSLCEEITEQERQKEDSITKPLALWKSEKERETLPPEVLREHPTQEAHQGRYCTGETEETISFERWKEKRKEQRLVDLWKQEIKEEKEEITDFENWKEQQIQRKEMEKEERLYNQWKEEIIKEKEHKGNFQRWKEELKQQREEQEEKRMFKQWKETIKEKPEVETLNFEKWKEELKLEKNEKEELRLFEVWKEEITDTKKEEATIFTKWKEWLVQRKEEEEEIKKQKEEVEEVRLFRVWQEEEVEAKEQEVDIFHKWEEWLVQRNDEDEEARLFKVWKEEEIKTKEEEEELTCFQKWREQLVQTNGKAQPKEEVEARLFRVWKEEVIKTKEEEEELSNFHKWTEQVIHREHEQEEKRLYTHWKEEIKIQEEEEEIVFQKWKEELKQEKKEMGERRLFEFWKEEIVQKEEEETDFKKWKEQILEREEEKEEKRLYKLWREELFEEKEKETSSSGKWTERRTATQEELEVKSFHKPWNEELLDEKEEQISSFVKWKEQLFLGTDEQEERRLFGAWKEDTIKEREQEITDFEVWKEKTLKRENEEKEEKLFRQWNETVKEKEEEMVAFQKWKEKLIEKEKEEKEVKLYNMWREEIKGKKTDEPETLETRTNSKEQEQIVLKHPEREVLKLHKEEKEEKRTNTDWIEEKVNSNKLTLQTPNHYQQKQEKIQKQHQPQQKFVCYRKPRSVTHDMYRMKAPTSKKYFWQDNTQKQEADCIMIGNRKPRSFTDGPYQAHVRKNFLKKEEQDQDQQQKQQEQHQQHQQQGQQLQQQQQQQQGQQPQQQQQQQGQQPQQQQQQQQLNLFIGHRRPSFVDNSTENNINLNENTNQNNTEVECNDINSKNTENNINTQPGNNDNDNKIANNINKPHKLTVQQKKITEMYNKILDKEKQIWIEEQQKRDTTFEEQPTGVEEENRIHLNVGHSNIGKMVIAILEDQSNRIFEILGFFPSFLLNYLPPTSVDTNNNDNTHNSTTNNNNTNENSNNYANLHNHNVDNKSNSNINNIRNKKIGALLIKLVILFSQNLKEATSTEIKEKKEEGDSREKVSLMISCRAVADITRKWFHIVYALYLDPSNLSLANNFTQVFFIWKSLLDYIFDVLRTDYHTSDIKRGSKREHFYEAAYSIFEEITGTPFNKAGNITKKERELNRALEIVNTSIVKVETTHQQTLSSHFSDSQPNQELLLGPVKAAVNFSNSVVAATRKILTYFSQQMKEYKYFSYLDFGCDVNVLLNICNNGSALLGESELKKQILDTLVKSAKMCICYIKCLGLRFACNNVNYQDICDSDQVNIKLDHILLDLRAQGEKQIRNHLKEMIKTVLVLMQEVTKV